MSGAWSQLEQLLTCCICLDRYRNPKLLPCQHSFCEPCLDGLVDYVKRQIKCPECRAEHRLSYTGDPNFPSNFTLQRFLELYQRLTGEEVEPLPSMLERCVICSEKAEVTVCGHCDKKVCEECKNAHIQILQRELARLNSQIRRALTRFNEELGQLKKCDDKLKVSCDQARTSIVDLAANLIGLIKEKEKQLLKELDDFQQSEDVNIKKLREGVDDEYNNLIANCELIEKNVLNYSASKQANQSNLNLNLALEDDDSQNETMQWTDLELVEYREIFLKTLEFLRNFETLDGMEYARSALKLDVIKDLDQLRKQTANYATLKVTYLATEKLQLQQQMIAQLAAGIPLNQTGSPNFAQQLGSTHALNQAGTNPGTQLNIPSQQSILMRSQSDHRLATQFAKKELLLQKQQANANKYGTTNYGSNYDENDLNSQYGVSSYYGPGTTQPGSTQYRSRFMREKNAELMHDGEDPYASYRGVRFDEQSGLQNLTAAQLAIQLHNAFKVFDTKDASRCPLSSIVKLNESMHLMERIEENKRKAKKLEKEKAELKKMSQPPKQPQTNPINQTNTNLNQSHQQQSLTNRQSPNQQQTNLPSTQPLQQNKAPPNRQVSEDEIDKQKRLNKQFEMQSLSQPDSSNVNTQPPAQAVQGIGALTQQQSQQAKQVLQKQNSIHGPEPTLQQSQLSNSLLVNTPHHHHQTRLNQTSSGPDDEEDEEIEDSVDEEDSEDEDENNLPGHQNTRQVISSATTQHTNNNSNKLSGQQRPSFEESESKLMPVTALTDHHSNDYVNKNSSSINTRRLSNSFDQQNSLMNIGRTSSIERDYGQTTGNSSYTSAGNKLSRQNSTNSSNPNQTNISNHSLTTPRNSIDIGSSGYNIGSRNNSFDRENGTSGYRYLTRANTRLDDLLNRDSYTNDNSSTSSNHNRFNRFNRLARSSTVSSLSPSYTGTSSNTSSNSGGSNSSGSSNYRTYDIDNTTSNYLTGSSGYSSSRNPTDTSNYLNIRSSSPPPQSRTGSSTNASSLSRYGIGNSSVGTSSGYRRSSGYTPDTSENEESAYKYRTRTPNKPLNRLLDEEKSTSLDTELMRAEKTKKNHLQKQLSLELKTKIDKAEDRKLKKSRTSGLYLASSKNVTFDQLSDLSDKEDDVKPTSNKLFESTDQILFKQRLEQRLKIYEKKGTIKFCIGSGQGSQKGQFKWPKDVCWAKFTLKTDLTSQQLLFVTDSGNARIQVFDTLGRLVNCFGENVEEENKFSCPTSVAVLDDGTFIVSDSDLHRLQFFDAKGQFMKQIGNKNATNKPNENQLDLNASTSSIISNFMKNLSQNNLKRQTSTDPGEFASPYGLCYDHIKNELYVCDRNNQRIQVFDSNGCFKRILCSTYKVSTRLNMGNQLAFKSPNFINSNGQYIIISDTNSHCVHRINLENGIELILGGEGTSGGKLKYPRGVYIDEFNFSIVADSGNNRVVIFTPEGNFLKSFGNWGAKEGEFKGIEGLSVDELGIIYVCDRENNKISVF